MRETPPALPRASFIAVTGHSGDGDPPATTNFGEGKRGRDHPDGRWLAGNIAANRGPTPSDGIP